MAHSVEWNSLYGRQGKFLFGNSLLCIVVKKLRKSVNICLSYRTNNSVSFFYGSQCMCTRFPAIFDRSLDCSFGWGLRTPNFGEGDAVGGRGWYRSKERW